MRSKLIGFVAGIVLFAAFILLPVAGPLSAMAGRLVADHGSPLDPDVLARSMQNVLAVLSLMVAWWLTEAVPLPATALMPALLLPLLSITGIQDGGVVEFTFRRALTNYANPVIFLFLGGFLIAGAMQKWKLDRRFTLWLLTRGTIANDSRSILFGMMAVTALLSMWISNTATAAMMLPLGLGVLSLMDLKPGHSRYGTALMLGIAWAASIGGIGTIIGTPPNGIALGILESAIGDTPGFERITFLDWMKFGVPLVVLFLPIAWYVVLKTNPPEVTRIRGGREKMREERGKLGPLSTGEWRTLLVFSGAVLCWLTNPFWDTLLPPALSSSLGRIDEYSIGLAFGVACFLVPVNIRDGVFVLDWRDTRFVDWGTLILFGGGIALSDAMFKTGLASWIATTFVGILGSPPTVLMILAVVFLVDFLTEVTSNTAVTSMMVPIFISIALTTGGDPKVLTLAAALAASMAFMLPVATPPNALVFSTGYVRIADMIRSGFILDISGWIIATTVILVFAGWIFGIVSL